MSSNGRRIWYIPDCEMPPAGSGPLLGHESVIILNPGKEDATVEITLYYTDIPPQRGISVLVCAERVRCLRTNCPSDFGGRTLPVETQYAMRLESSVPIIVQYGRLDVRQANMAFYTTLGLGV